MSVTNAGISVPTTIEIRDALLDKYVALSAAAGAPVTLSAADRELADRFDVLMATATAQSLRELWEAIQAVFDARDPNNATGRLLEILLQIVGVPVLPATRSTASITLTGTTGTVVPEGKVFEGGGADDDARWTTTEDVTLVAGTGTVVVEAQEYGRVEAQIGAIDKIVTPVSGLTSITNAAIAAPGRDRESNAAMRERRADSLAQRGAGTAEAVRAKVLGLSFVTSVLVIQNRAAVTATVQTVSMPANSLSAYILPAAADLTTAQTTELVEAIHATAPSATQLNGANSATVTDAAGAVQTIKWSDLTDKPLTIAITVTLLPGYALVDVSDAVEEAIDTYINGLDGGATVYDLQTRARVAAVEGVAGISALTYDDGTGPAAGDYVTTVTDTVSTTLALITVS